MLVRFLEDFVDVVLVGLEQRADLERRMAAEGGDVFARQHRVGVGFVALLAQPGDDRDAVVAEDHEAVVHVAHHAGELELEDAVEALDHLLGQFRVELVNRSWRAPRYESARMLAQRPTRDCDDAANTSQSQRNPTGGRSDDEAC